MGGIESRPELPKKPGKRANLEEHFGSEVKMRGGHANLTDWHENQWAALAEALDMEEQRILYGSGPRSEDEE